MPHEAIRKYLRARIARTPSFDDSRVDIHEPQFLGRRTEIESALESAVEPCRGWRKNLHREQQGFNDGPVAFRDSLRRNR